ncbi:SusC/RagA family TonB-linked outer membrane protein [Puia dinghuensis]|uniref:SusC/RagA family TonB-linked outer membrane protein n=2 Tax=Puia dinghuensis TaxID=1792502 RepID=A0A8J2UCE1_9BACT|nr:SusC/RagA family TonB-linked outer membrane protein [Puia dinghuensis]
MFRLRNALLPFLLLILFITARHPAMAQATKTVSGKVVNSTTGEPVAGASVRVKGLKGGTTTDSAGFFTWTVPASASTLIVSSVGFHEIEIPADGSHPAQIKLAAMGAKDLGEVVVVGYGTQKKATLTGAVATVDSKVFRDRGVVDNPLASLQGQVPGVVVTRSSAAPGQEGWAFQIRGATSVNGAVDPLVLVDGVPLQDLSALNSINPQDIDNMSFLKDASASIYGSRAAGGVVLITTKRAKAGIPTIEYSSSVSQKRMGLRPEFLNGDQYGNYMLQAISNASLNGVADPNWIWTKYANAWIHRPDSGYIDKTVPGYVDNIGFTDVKDYTFFNTNPIDILWGDGRAISTQHDLSLSARTDKMGYRLSLGYLKDGSMLKWGDNYNDRYTVSLAHDYTFSPKLKISSNISLQRNNVVVPTRQGVIDYSSQPGFPVATKNGDPYAWGTQEGRNWLLKLGGDNKTYDTRAFLNTKLEFNITKDLNFIGQAGYNWFSKDTRLEYSGVTNIFNYADTYQYQDNPTQAQSYYTRGNTQDVYYNLNAYLQYKKTIADDHSIGATAGASYERDEYDAYATTTTYLASNDVPSLGLGLGDNTTHSNGEVQNHWSLGSYFGRVNYAYKEKYLLEAQGRFDGNSRFYSANRWLFYDGFSAGWRISQEKFMGKIKFLNELKLRAAYGTAGGQGAKDANGNLLIGYYDYIPTVFLGNGGPVLGGYSSRSITATPNSTITDSTKTWEKIVNKNIGLDFTVLNNRLSGSVDYFWKENTNMLLQEQFPSVGGFTAPYRNIADLKTWGWELSINWRDKVGQVSYHIGGTLTDNNNKIVTLQGANNITIGQHNIQGYAIGSYFGLLYAGRIQTDKQASDYALLAPNNSIGMPTVASQVIKGMNMYRDLNGDGMLTNAGASQHLLNKTDASGKPIGDGDVVYLGRSDPRYVFALNLGAEYKGFDVAVVFQGVGQRIIYRRSDWSVPFGTIWQGHANWWVGKTWTPQTPNAPLPILTTATNNGFGGYNYYDYQMSDWSLQNGAYVRLKNIVIGYTLSPALAHRAKVQGLRVYVSGNDLWELTHVQDKWDPEQTSSVSGGPQRYPFYRLLTFGVNVTF